MRKTLFAVLCLLVIVISCSPITTKNSIELPKIDQHPSPLNFTRGILTELPSPNMKGNEHGLETPDLRGYDLSNLDLRNSLEYILQSWFDDRTIWPDSDKMPPGFDVGKIMEYGKNPGLGVRKLHELGFTGKNVGVAIIDHPLLVDHQEYVDRLQLYEELDDITGETSSMHGAGVASIAVGKTVGVAPGADLYYIATIRRNGEDFSYLAKAINRIVEVNAQLPKEKKIRVITMQIGWDDQVEGYELLMEAIEQAMSENIFVISSSLEFYTPYKFQGLGRYPLDNPDQFDVYLPGFFWASAFYRREPINDRLLIPMDSRATAGPTGIAEYAFFYQGGWSWVAPYLAGVYALAAQADPKITPERFWDIAMRTGRTNTLGHEGKLYALGPIVDPAAIIVELKKQP